MRPRTPEPAILRTVEIPSVETSSVLGQEVIGSVWHGRTNTLGAVWRPD